MCPDINESGPRCGVETDVVDFRRLERRDEGRREAEACKLSDYYALNEIVWLHIVTKVSSRKRTSGADDSLVVHKPGGSNVSIALS